MLADASERHSCAHFGTVKSKCEIEYNEMCQLWIHLMWQEYISLHPVFIPMWPTLLLPHTIHQCAFLCHSLISWAQGIWGLNFNPQDIPSSYHLSIEAQQHNWHLGGKFRVPPTEHYCRVTNWQVHYLSSWILLISFNLSVTHHSRFWLTTAIIFSWF
jgi:hypothetical protein